MYFDSKTCIGLSALLLGGSLLPGIRSTDSPQSPKSGAVSLLVANGLAGVRPRAPKLDLQHTKNGYPMDDIHMKVKVVMGTLKKAIDKAKATKEAQKLLQKYFDTHTKLPQYQDTENSQIFDNGDGFEINNEEGGGKPIVRAIQFLLKQYLDNLPSEDVYSDQIQSKCQALFDELVGGFYPNMDSMQLRYYAEVRDDILGNTNTTIQDIIDKLNQKSDKLNVEYSSRYVQNEFSRDPEPQEHFRRY